MMKFSIIIPARNEEKYIVKTLQSIEDQNYPDYETIVVANNCTDNTVAVASKYADKVFSLDKGGVSAARNYGAKQASGDVLVFLDADTILSGGVLERIRLGFGNEYSVGTVKVRPNSDRLRFKVMMGFKNLINVLGLYPWTNGIIYCRKGDFTGFDENLNIKENYYFVCGLMKKGKFQFLNKVKVVTSMRRHEKWGSFRLMLFFIGKWFKRKFSKVDGDEYEVVR